jgi:hypothetical protein
VTPGAATNPWRRLGVFFAGLAIFALNAWICHRLFAVEFTRNLQSNEAAFMAIARFYRDHAGDIRWFPWFDGGMPIENAYQPVLPALSALISAVTGWSIARAFHFVLALAYCFGPAALFWMVYEWTANLLIATLAGVAWSVLSPATLLIPSLRALPAGIWTPERLNNLVFYGEGPHVLALALFPVAMVFLRRAILRRDPASLAGAIVSCSAVVLSNAFGAVTLALGALCVALALRRGARIVLITGIAAWLLSSPWLPPALLDTIRRNAWTSRGFYHAGPAAYSSLALLLAFFGAAWLYSRRLASPFERFVLLFAPWMCALPLAAFTAHVTLVPQAHRYQLEMEIAICLAFAWVAARGLSSPAPAVRWIAAAALFGLFVYSARKDRNFAHDLIRPIDISQTVEYKLSRWIDRNLPGRRVMVSGDAAYILNVFSDNPQLSGGHEPTAPNFLQQIAVYQIYTGDHAGEIRQMQGNHREGDGQTSFTDDDARVSLLWLKAFGVDAITVPGDMTREFYMPFRNPAKFDGILPVLWREDGDTIYAVPRAAASLARVIPRTAVITRAPVHGMDLDQLLVYVAALDDASMPAASLRWEGQSRATIDTRVEPAQVLSVQIAWDPGWHASVGGKNVPLTKDGLGQMVVDARCDGACEIRLTYGTSPAVWLCRAASALAILAMSWLFLKRRQRPVFPE